MLSRRKVVVNVGMRRLRAVQRVEIEEGGVVKRKGEEAANKEVKEGFTGKEASFTGSEVNSGL